MPTSDARLARQSLRVLGDVGVRYALLDDSDRLRTGETSDVDTVVDRPGLEVVAAAWREWASLGVVPIAVSRYDLGGSVAVFLSTADGLRGAQLDFLYDTRGRGRLGVRSEPLLNSASVDVSPPVVSVEGSLVYLWRKRLWKRQRGRLQSLRDRAALLDRDDLLTVSLALTGSPRSGLQLLGERAVPRRWYADKRFPIARSARLASRLARHVGFWAHVRHEELAVELADRLSRTLVRGVSGAVPGMQFQIPWHLTSVFPVTVRPGVFVSYGQDPARLLRPHLIVKEDDPDLAAAQITAEMAERVRRATRHPAFTFR